MVQAKHCTWVVKPWYLLPVRCWAFIGAFPVQSRSCDVSHRVEAVTRAAQGTCMLYPTFGAAFGAMAARLQADKGGDSWGACSGRFEQKRQRQTRMPSDIFQLVMLGRL